MAPLRGPTAIFDVIADFLDKCQFKAAATAIRVQCGEKRPSQEGEFVKNLKILTDSAALILAEFEAGIVETREKGAAEPDQEASLEQIMDGLLRKFMAAGHGLSDDILSQTMKGVLSSEALPKSSSLDGASKKLLDDYTEGLGINEIDVNHYWEQIQKESMVDVQPQASTSPAVLAPGSSDGALDISDVGVAVQSASSVEAAVVTEGHAQDASVAAPCPPVAVPPPPSAHYKPKRGNVQQEEEQEPWDEGDEYHDDDDPGYRIREIYEAELLEELASKMPSAPDTATDELASCAPTPATPEPGQPEAAQQGTGPSSPPAVPWIGEDTSLGVEGQVAGSAPPVDDSTGTAGEASNSSSKAAHPPDGPADAEPERRHSSPMFGGATAGDEPEDQALPVVQAATEKAPPPPGQVEQRPKFRRALQYAPSGDSFYPVELDGVVYDSFGLRVVFERDKTGFEESKEFPIRINSVVAARYQILEYLGSAAFSRAVQCLDLETKEMVCMKIIKNDKDFFDQSLDEIKLLKYINVNGDVDENCVLRLYDYFYHKEHLIIVTELLRDNLYEFSKFNRDCGEEPYFTFGRLQKIAHQCLTALDYVHSLRLIHCDLKPENILIRSYSRCEVKVIDFGSSCFVDDHLSSYVQSRSYRAPEVMLGLPYNQKIDLWSLGCILAELWTGYVLFQNDSVQSLLARIIGIIGDFPYHLMTRGKYVPQYFTQDGQLYLEIDGPACPNRGRRLHLLVPKKTSLQQRMRTDCKEFLDFLGQLLQLDAAKRPTASEALQHPWLTQCKYTDGL